MTRIFISYRRNESEADAWRIYDYLKQHFGAENIFLDTITLTPGTKFTTEIITTVKQCEALIALIGKNWLNVKDENGTRKLDNPDDLLRLEISIALEREILVIPVLVGGAIMPKEQDLPDNLSALAQYHAFTLNHASFDHDIQNLIAALDGIIRTTAPSQTGNLVEKYPIESAISQPVNKFAQSKQEIVADFFGFTLEELNLNRRGVVSERQLAMLHKRAKARTRDCRNIVLLMASLSILALLLLPVTSKTFIDARNMVVIGGVLIALIAFGNYVEAKARIFKRPKIFTAIGKLRYSLQSNLIYIGTEPKQSLINLDMDLRVTPLSPPSGDVYYVYYAYGVLLSIEPEDVLK